MTTTNTQQRQRREKNKQISKFVFFLGFFFVTLSESHVRVYFSGNAKIAQFAVCDFVWRQRTNKQIRRFPSLQKKGKNLAINQQRFLMFFTNLDE
jgi:hypothetical protein